jgi:hypothetical protein
MTATSLRGHGDISNETLASCERWGSPRFSRELYVPWNLTGVNRFERKTIV